MKRYILFVEYPDMEGWNVFISSHSKSPDAVDEAADTLKNGAISTKIVDREKAVLAMDHHAGTAFLIR